MKKKFNYERKLMLVVFIFIIVASTLNIMWMLVVYMYFGRYDYDLITFSESLETTIRGKGFFFNSVEWKIKGAWSHFGVHNSPILFILLPIYAICPEPLFLNVIQIIFVGFGAMTLFKLAKEILKDDKKAFMISIAYLMNPFTHGLVRHDFHPCVLVVPFMFLFAYYIVRNDTKKAFIMALFVLSAKEDAGLFLIAHAMFEVLRRHNFNLGEWFGERKVISFALLGLTWIIVSIFIVIPHFNLIHQHPCLSRYTEFSTRLFVIATVKLLIFFATLIFLPLRKIAYTVPLIFLWLENAFAFNPLQVAIGWQYDYMVLVMGFMVLVYATRERETNLAWLIRVNIVLMLLFSPFSPVSIVFGELVYRALWWYWGIWK